MTNLRRGLALSLLAPVALAAVTIVGVHDSVDGGGASPSLQTLAAATKCVGVDHGGVQWSQCVPFPDTLG